ncbi:MAG: cellulose biosynthesis cyclic di-GMP-binding regulatory protein BcsB, partial [Aeromonas sobria]
MMKLQHLILPLLLAAPVALATGPLASSSAMGPQPPVPAPVRTLSLTLEQLAAAPGTLSLRGNLPDGLADFTVRRDEVVTRALVDVDFTPSPALLPLISQLKLYFNNELMGVSAFAK